MGKHISFHSRPQGKIGINRMRVGCSLKTKDGLLDIWTSTADYIKLYVLMGISADGFKASARLCMYKQSRNTQRASVRCSMAERKSIKGSHLLQKDCSRIYKP